MEIGYVVNMADRNKFRTLMGPPCRMTDGCRDGQLCNMDGVDRSSTCRYIQSDIHMMARKSISIPRNGPENHSESVIPGFCQNIEGRKWNPVV